MSEAMGLEHLTSQLAQVEGFLTDTRIPYTARLNKRGEEKTDSTQGDLDVVGLGPLEGESRRLLVAECKGYGAPESYPCWLVPNFLMHIEDMVWNVASNIAAVSDVRWEPEFTSRGGKPTDCWIVFPGHFMPGKNNPANWVEGPVGYKEFLAAMKPSTARAWNAWTDEKASEFERDLLRIAETHLSQEYGLRVRLLPVHIMLETLIIGVSSDMGLRRKRYPSPASEMIRWMVRAVRNEVMDLGVLSERIKSTGRE